MTTKQIVISRALRSTALSSSLILSMMMAQGAMAQDQDQDQDATQVEEVVVTGSRIARDPNVGSNQPIQSISGEDIQLAGQLDLGEILNDIPALLTSNTASNSVAGIFGSGSGETAGGAEVGETILQLRGLGIERTLVLINGRRHVAGVGGSQAVDIGSIPQQLIERVEVLTGGASAIYGADAVTGVINFIMKTDFEGFDFNLTGGISGQGDGERFSASAIYGKNFSDGRGNFTVSVQYSRSEAITAGDRAFSRNNGIASDDQNPDLRFQIGDIDPTATPNFSRFYSPTTAFASTDAPCNRFGGAYNYCYGFFPTGFPILTADEFINLYTQAFPSDPVPVLTSAELALIDRAANAPTRAILKQHNFSLSSPGGVILAVAPPSPFGFSPGIDIDGNGIDDCLQSFEGYTSLLDFSPPAFAAIGGCWIIQDNGTVRPFQDGLIAGEINQFGADGIADVFDEDFLLPDTEKFAVNVSGNYQITDGANFFFEGKYVRQTSEFGGPLNTFWDLLTISSDNPFLSQLPAELAAFGQANGLFITRDPADLGPNIDKNLRETYRIVAGFDGELSNGWNYEVSVNYGKFTLRAEDRNRVIVDRWFAAIDVIDNGSGTPICRSDVDSTPPPTTPFDIPAFLPGFFTFNPGDGQCQPANILGGRGGISQAAIDFITATVVNNFETEQLVFSGVITGDTGKFLNTAAGPIAFAVGAELRSERSTAIFDDLVLGILPVTTADGTAGELLSDIFDGVEDSQRSLVFDSESLIQNVTGNYDVGDIFAEISVPVVKGMRFAEELTLDAAVRYSDYSTVGSTLTWKFGGSWTPMDGLRFRGTYSVAVRAPNIQELFSPAQGAFFRPVDPCDQAEIDALNDAGDPRGPIRAANCLAAGIGMGFNDPLTARFVGETSGNPNLTEETAKSFTIGAIIQPKALPGLTLTVDYWNIVINDAIDAPSAQDIVNGCYDSLDFPNNAFCPLVRRNDDQTSPQFNGLEFIRQQQLNIGALEAAGIDITARYQFEIRNFAVALVVSGTKMQKLDRFFDPSNPSAVDPELGELQRPKWAGNININVRRGALAVNWQTQYLGKQALRGVEIETVDSLYGPAGIAGNSFIHDLSFSYEVSDTYQIYGGINNVGDKQPFLTENAFPVSPLGRVFFLGANAHF